MRSRTCLNRLGQAAMIDAILFMTIMVIACAVVIGSSQGNRSALVQRNGLQQYTRDFTDTFLALELDDLYYLDANGALVNLTGFTRSIGLLLSEELLLISEGAPASGFADGYETRIFGAGRALARQGTDFALLCELGDDTPAASILMSEHITSLDDLPVERCASQRTFYSGSWGADSITITVYVWVIQ